MIRALPCALLVALLSLLAAGLDKEEASRTLRVLIIDGRNNHDWEATTDALRATLSHTGRFKVEVATAPERKLQRPPRKPRKGTDQELARYAEAAAACKEQEDALRADFAAEWERWSPAFGEYDAVILNYNGPSWPEAMRENFVRYVREGGGVVVVHAANNGFADWDEFNQIIGMGWRKAPYGKALKIDPVTGTAAADPKAPNSGHGSKHPFAVTVRDPVHPIMKGIPKSWMHGKDELYHHMRGPAANLRVLSSAFSDPKTNGSGQHEPITWEVGYGKGRVIVTSMGHFWRGQDWWDSLYCVGFQTILARAAEFVASGAVTLPVPEDFPTSTDPSLRAPHAVKWTSGNETPPSSAGQAAEEKKAANPYAMLRPGEEHATFEIEDGYRIELAAAEPDVQEPVLTVWDGNGALYVAEMRSYMQDEKGTGTKTLKNGRIKRLEDTNGDGRYDRVTIFADNLNLPRMILPLDDRLAVRETDSTEVWSYRDTDRDGVADEKKQLFAGSHTIAETKSVEHQDSGLHWNLDNWIYVSYGRERYRFTDGEWKIQKLHGYWAQWGLDHDDVGRVYYSANSEPAKSIQVPRQYWLTAKRRAKKGLRSGDPVSFGPPYEQSFLRARSRVLLNDRGGSASEFRGFTSVCGQSVYRGASFPIDARGDFFAVDPTIHIVRRAAIADRDGQLFLKRTGGEDDPEFLSSSDINFRPVNTATGPDGCLYVTDMYRGIIQDAPWLSPGPREFIVQSGLAKNTQHGRIWRVRHRNHEPTAMPRMLEESTVALVRHLQHKNGWWRDTAQRLIILRPDRDEAIPFLEAMARYEEDALARLHALWTLEGISAIDRDLLRAAYKDRDPRIRAAAIQLTEPFLTDSTTLADLAPLANDRDAEVAKQLILSLGTIDSPRATELVQEAARKHLAHGGVILATSISLWGDMEAPLVEEIADGKVFDRIRDPATRATAATRWSQAIAQWSMGLNLPKDLPKADADLVKRGELVYFSTCVSCHGPEGKGITVPGAELQLAPPLAGSKRVQGPPGTLVPILLHGLIGPLDGKNYQAAFMAPATALGIGRDDRIAEVLSYIRYAWGQEGPTISKEVVEKIRRSTKRETPWTLEELEKAAR